MARPEKDPKKDILFEAILSLETVEECYHFFEDLCTIKELDDMAKRMWGAMMLADNKVYTEITEATGLSTATISRINRCLKYGQDGYSSVIEKMKEKNISGTEGDKDDA